MRGTVTYDELLTQCAHGGTPAIHWYDRLSDWMLTGDCLADLMHFIFRITKEQ